MTNENSLITSNSNLPAEAVQISGEVANPFGGSLAQVGSVGAAQAVSHELAEMQAAIFLAKQFPRDQRKATDQILTACQRLGLAQVAVYSYARGGSNISGPSIRLAEEIARDWGNLECGWNELERDVDSSKVRAFAWDKESNVLKTLFFYVPHYRTTKQGRKRITDERDLYELLANQAARRMRNCILALIPGDVVDAAVEQCQRTMVTKCEITPETIKKLVQAFEPFGVTKSQIEKRIQRKIDSIAPAQFVRMREIYTSLRDGMSDPSDWFEIEEEAEPVPANAATESLKSALGGRKGSARASKKQKAINTPSTETETAQSDSEPNYILPEGEPYIPEGLEAQLRQEIANSRTKEELEILASQVGDLDLPQEVKDSLLEFVETRSVDLDFVKNS